MTIIRRYCLLLVCSLLLLPLSPVQAQKPESVFEPKTFEDGDFTLPYRIYSSPEIKAGDQAVLILFFHGAGERGDNNVRQLHHAIPSILSYVVKNKIPAIILAPQCPNGMQWVNVPWGGMSHTMPKEPSKPMHAAMALLQQTIQEMPVDPKRIYVAGISMGGFGTWDLIQREPGLFAAALPVCGGGDTAEAKNLVNLPIWTFHGDKDTTVKTQRSRDMVAAIKDAGGTQIQYTEYPEIAHNSWTMTFKNDEVMDWLFSQKKE